MSIDRSRIEAAVAELLAAIGEDVTREGLEQTPARVADAYSEFFAGLDADPVAPLADAVPVGDVEPGLVVMRGIEFRSVCEHHLLPFLGRAHIAYLPDAKVVGLGRLPRVVEALAARPQVQERLGEQIADALVAGLAPQGVLVVLEAVHQCVTTRGARQTGASVVTVAERGVLAEPAGRAEALLLIGAAGAATGPAAGAATASHAIAPDGADAR